MRIWTVDAFASQPFKGNPAAVTIWSDFPDHAMMKNIALEMNLSETAFLVKLADNHFRIRWFTPELEVRLCGHATMASAHILWTEGFATSRPLIFESLSGPLRVSQSSDGPIVLDFPAQPPVVMKPPEGLLNALGVSEPVAVAHSNRDFLVEVETTKEVRELNPDFMALSAVSCRAVMVTARGNPDEPYDFVSRFFAPREGLNEDPVTGSAHCKLAPYWGSKLNKSHMKAFQASKRGGGLLLELKGDRVLIAGYAVTVLSGEINPIHAWSQV